MAGATEETVALGIHWISIEVGIPLAFFLKLKDIYEYRRTKYNKYKIETLNVAVLEKKT